jgi:predicted nucleic acid-binding protein
MSSGAHVDVRFDTMVVAETRDAARAGRGVTDLARERGVDPFDVMCDVALAEICTALQQGAQALEALEEMGIGYSATEAKAAIRAGEMQRRFRQRSGMPPGARLRSASDFIIGAHALLQCNALITHDEDFFRDYFKGLKIIVPSAA